MPAKKKPSRRKTQLAGKATAKPTKLKWKKGSFVGVHSAEMGRCYLMVRDDPYGSGMHSRLWVVLGPGGKILADGKSKSQKTVAASDSAAKKKAISAARALCKMR